MLSFSSSIFQHAIIDGIVSDHQLIYCRRKIDAILMKGIHKLAVLRSLKNHGIDVYERGSDDSDEGAT